MKTPLQAASEIPQNISFKNQDTQNQSNQNETIQVDNNTMQFSESMNNGTPGNPANEQAAGTCPLFGASRQPHQPNPYYAAPSNEPQAAMQPFGKQTMNNPYITTQNPSQASLQNPNLPNNAPAAPVLPDASSATSDFIKGALIGAAVTYLLNNEKVQNALFKTVAKTSSMFQTGMEEVKERYEDAKAETAANNMDV